ncbi:hypothetical protein PCANB_003048 [Pneumocystis canis]|nr:hypothetical protein PCANB_003048 [Pneumocystis canis]
MPLRRKSAEQPDTPRRSLRIKNKEDLEISEKKHLKSIKRSQNQKTTDGLSTMSIAVRKSSTRSGRTNRTMGYTTEIYKKKEITPRNTLKSTDTERRILKPIQLGDTLPDIILKNEYGEDVNIQKIADNYPVIIFAYPKASTPGCTVQGCGFRDNYAAIESKNYRIYGLSMDTPKAQLAFKMKQNFPYHLLSDPKAELIGVLGASKSGFKIARSHWIFNKGGTLLDMKIGVSPKDSVEKVMAKISEQKE